MRIKKITVCIIIAVITVGFSCVESYASQIDEYGEIYNSISDDSKKLLESAGVYSVDFDDLMSLSYKKTFTVISELIMGRYKEPLKSFLIMLGFFIASSFVRNFSDNLSDANENMFAVFETAFLICIIAIPLSDAVTSAFSSIKTVGDFMLSYIPVYTALISASGQPITSFTYSSVVIGFAEVLTKSTELFIVPLICIMTCLNVYSSLNENLNFEKITALIKKTITVLLSVAASVFVGLINIKGNLSVSADNLALKGIKTASGSLIPIIGSTVGEALTSILGSFSLIKNVFGAFGIIAVVITVIPSVIELLIWYFFISITAALCKSFSNGHTVKILDSLCSTVSLVNIFLIFTAAVFVLTTGTILSFRS